MTIRAIHSTEAQIESEKILNSPKNILTITGSNNRKISDEAVQGLYFLSMRKA